jgi:Ca2+-binding RTX toxin-like protein
MNVTLAQGATSNTLDLSADGLGIDSYKNFEGIIGSHYADLITGSAGNDILIGGGGGDTLTGGGGADKFVFLSPTDGGANGDLIVDFVTNLVNGSDELDFDTVGFAALQWSGTSLAAGQLLSGAGLTATSANSASVHLIYDTTSGRLWYDADGQGGQSGTLVATLGTTNHPSLQITDIHPWTA